MANFSNTSSVRLHECHPDLIKIMNIAIKIVDFSVSCGYRNQLEQDEAFRTGRSKLKFPSSLHNSTPSMAIDINPYPIDFNDPIRYYHLAGVIKGVAHMLYEQGIVTHKVRFGGDWDRDNEFKDEKFIDLPHIELVSA